MERQLTGASSSLAIALLLLALLAYSSIGLTIQVGPSSQEPLPSAGSSTDAAPGTPPDAHGDALRTDGALATGAAP
ncbi:MAG: hypothetical protein JXA09_00135 [Anaerolineae bacterium]|nr:hypothetical protein [Anaerolineae bacterium]